MDRTLLKTLMALVLTALLIALCYLFVDRPIAEAAFGLKHTFWHSLAKYISQAANHFFVNILVAIALIYGAVDTIRNGSSDKSRHLLYMGLTVASAMLIGDVFKEICGRARPPLLFEKGIYGFFPMAGDYLHFSFPSGHTLRIFSSMVALGYVLPKLRYPALCLAGAVGASRVLALKHYPSDVLFGAFIGTTCAIWGWRLLYPYGRRT
ncbi:phosphatase PAP2 family protein [Pseudodesulfovibrio sp. zrk46]|uniref:phosphatase PAP2 family protein n=1 Tax=Pseudodesulfovibrio sp. zrk46 TaxID=2725288 RepID=UPI00144989F2|nr:phosphatase PAP2 family protein [Pseudodesulfovibrio sp. zrk46]QJB55281.1 phosphatase PAP2 family protein [Pseudodesulfovibrio sp. zrk46]